MAMAMCCRCDKRVDLDWNAEDMAYIDHPLLVVGDMEGKPTSILPVCLDCLTPEELAKLEADEAKA